MAMAAESFQHALFATVMTEMRTGESPVVVFPAITIMSVKVPPSAASRLIPALSGAPG